MTRALDIVIASLVLLAAAPLLAIAALGTKLTSRGPVLYRATRAGANGVPFTMYKLRSMHVDAGAGGPITGAGDPRVFPWGRMLRRLKLDELPQLLNVVRGDMSLVGPRPEDLEIVRSHYTPFMWESLTVRPGVTGPGSLDYFAKEDQLPPDAESAHELYLRELLPRKIALDLAYVRHQSIGYYLQLALRTVLGVARLSGLFARKARWEQAQADKWLSETPGAAA